MKTNREKALEWWNQTPNRLKHQFCDNYLFSIHLSKYTRHYSSLSGREIEEIWRKENLIDALPDKVINTNLDGIEEEHSINPWEETYPQEGQRMAKEAAIKSTFQLRNHKSNQKQFKEFNPELFKAYINKFSEEDKVKAIKEIIKDLKIGVYVNYIQEEEISYWEFNSERIITWKR